MLPSLVYSRIIKQLIIIILTKSVILGSMNNTCQVVLYTQDENLIKPKKPGCNNCHFGPPSPTQSTRFLSSNEFTLRKVIETAKRVKSESLVSIISKKESVIVHQILQTTNMIQLQIRREDCQLNRVLAGSLVFLCPSWTYQHFKALVEFIKFTGQTRITILRSDRSCYATISSNILSRLYNIWPVDINGDQTLYSVRIFPERNISSSAVLTSLTNIRTSADSVILLICSYQALNLIFQIANSLNMLGYDYTWIFIGDNVDIDRLDAIPLQFIIVKRSLITGIHELAFRNPDYLRSLVDQGCLEAGVIKREWMKDKEFDGSVFTRVAFGNFYNNSMENYCDTDYQSKTAILIRQTEFKKWIPLLQQTGLMGTFYYPDNYKHYHLFKLNRIKDPLRVVTILDPPFTIQASYLYQGNNGASCFRGLLCHLPKQGTNGSDVEYTKSCCIGHSIDLLQLLVAELKVPYFLYIVADGYYGAFVNGRWNGMIGDVISGKADLSMAGLTITKDRMRVVDFSEAFMQSDVGITTTADTSSLDFINWKFLQPLEKEIIWGVVTMFLIGTVLIYILENQEVAFKRLVNPILYPPRYRCKEGFTYFSGLTFQRDLGGKNPIQLSARITAVIFAFGMVIIMTTYTAILTASKVQRNNEAMFLGLKDPKMTTPTNDFKFATARHTSIETFFRNAPDKSLNRMYHFMKKYNVETVKEGLEKVLKGDLQAFINEYPFLLYHISRQTKCTLNIVRTPIMQSGYGVAIKKKSKWKHRISNAILQFKENGFLAELNKKWLAKGCASSSSNSAFLLNSLSVPYFGGLILVLAGSLGLAFILLILENIYFIYHRVPIDAVVKAAIDYHEKKKDKKLRRLSRTAKPRLKSFRVLDEFDTTRL